MSADAFVALFGRSRGSADEERDACERYGPHGADVLRVITQVRALDVTQAMTRCIPPGSGRMMPCEHAIADAYAIRRGRQAQAAHDDVARSAQQAGHYRHVVTLASMAAVCYCLADRLDEQTRTLLTERWLELL